MNDEELRRALRLVVITDRRMAAPRSVENVVTEALEGGARAIQLRDKRAGAHELLASARRLLRLTRPAGALLIVNDRVDVALAAGAQGVHLGPGDLPLRTVRGALPGSFVIGYSTDDPEEAIRAEGAGADYIGCGAVFPTASKDVGDEAIGVEGLDAVARAVSVPVLGIGGITPDRAAAVAATAATGVAVIGAVMGAEDPRHAVRSLLAPFEARAKTWEPEEEPGRGR
ncbi:MAG TPA: thiamine phosphate synthase [Longimicrobiales bacterium]|nr:thiamine phosphate synthase [Longimicrobiales bacterium]